jgi:hypothetical protein
MPVNEPLRGQEDAGTVISSRPDSRKIYGLNADRMLKEEIPSLTAEKRTMARMTAHGWRRTIHSPRQKAGKWRENRR